MFEFLFGGKKVEKTETEPAAPPPPLEDLSPIFAWLHQTLGIADLHQRAIVADRLRFLAQKYGIATADAFVAALSRDASLKNAVIDAVTVNETYFFREYDTLHLAAERAVQLSRPRVLSIPCSDGAELYSLRILLQELAPGVSQCATCLGIDVSAHAIEKAREGLYSEHAIHRLDAVAVARYFTREGSLYRINPEFRRDTHFEVGNLFDTSAALHGAFDLVLSRNLLIYFDQDGRRRAMTRLSELVAPGGWLVLGVSDPVREWPGFRRVRHAVFEKEGP
jgi:chemotaxis protein methyltransferase CheR